MFKNLFKTIVGTVVSFYVTKVVNDMLERKPLKTRVREAKTRVIDLKDQCNTKLTDVKGRASQKVNRLIEERPADQNQP